MKTKLEIENSCRQKLSYERIIPFYIFVKIALYSSVTILIYTGISSSLPYYILGACSIITDLLAFFVGWNFLRPRFQSSKVLKIILIFVLITLYTYPIAWDDIAYGLVLPEIFFERRSFNPISEFTMFTYFPLIEYSRTALSYAFGNILQIFIYRLECLAIFVLAFESLFKIGELIPKSKINRDENLPYILMSIFTTVSAFSVFAFIKPESFIYLCFTFGVYSLLVGDSFRAFAYSFISLPFKATSIFTSLPVFFLAVISFKRGQRRLKIFEYITLALIILVTIIWLLHNYKNTGNPVYPFLQAFFPYASDGVLNGHVYDDVIALLRAQRDVSIRNLYSIKLYLKNILTQLNFLLIPLLAGIFFICNGKVKAFVTIKFKNLLILILISFLLFLFKLFNEFRYAYGPVSLIALTALIIIANTKFLTFSANFKRIIILIIILQLCFITARNIKNSSINFSRSYFPMNLSVEQIAEVNCVNSIDSPAGRIATFDQTFYLWNAQFYLLHELNEYIGMYPTSNEVRYAFDKHKVKYILLRDQYLEQEHLDSLDFGGNYRQMPSNVLKRIREVYSLERVDLPKCSNYSIFLLKPKN